MQSVATPVKSCASVHNARVVVVVVVPKQAAVEDGAHAFNI